MTKKNVLIYLQDMGGINYLLPIIKELLDEPWYDISTKIAHHASLGFLKEKNISGFKNLKEKGEISIEEWKKFIEKNKISFVITTLSSKEKDRSNSHLLSVCNEIDLSSVGFLDHWKGSERLINDEGNYHFHPSYLGVIDDQALRSVKKLPLEFKKICVTGHPVLEKIQSRSLSLSERNNRNILLVSQPKVFKGSFTSLFSTKNNKGITLLDEMIDLAKELEILDRLSYRPHPKEERDSLLPKGFHLESSNSKNYIMNSYDYFLGFDSMLLVEAHAAGKVSISINFDNVSKYFKDRIPYDYSYKVSSLAELRKLLKTNGLSPLPKVDYSFSVKKSLEVIYESIGQGEA